jgi:hypothetical protein
MEIFSNINWVAVVVGWLFTYALGALWFSPMMFLNIWTRGMGEVKVQWSLLMLMSVQAVTSFVFALSLALAMEFSFVLAIVIALAVVGTVKSFALYSGKTIGSTATETGYTIAQAAIVIAVVYFMK